MNLVPAPAGLYALVHSAPGETEKWWVRTPIIWMCAKPVTLSESRIDAQYFDLDGEASELILHEPSGHVYSIDDRWWRTFQEWLDDQA